MKYHTALILGMGASGMAAARALSQDGTIVTVIDSCESDELRASAAQLQDEGIRASLSVAAIPEGRFDVCVVSPGVSVQSDWVGSARKASDELISELELGARLCTSRILAITGSNGKSTMAKLCYDALRVGGQAVEIGGNYGTPLCEVAGRSDALDWVVVEVSSFQLETVAGFRPSVGVLLNVQPDHLDRHGDMTRYKALKLTLFRNMGAGDTGIVPCELRKQAADVTRGHVSWRTFGCVGSPDYLYESGRVIVGNSADVEPVAYSVEGTSFANNIMGATVAAAAAAIDACGVDAHTVETAAREFECLPHRMSVVAMHGGVTFIDDSKATNLSAMCAALEMSPGPVRLIAGGLGKNENMNSVKEVLASRVRSAYLIGSAACAMEGAWGADISCRLCSEMQTAVRAASDDAQAGDVVLLSPGCASFDQFENYDERGEMFARIVKDMLKER